MKVRYIHHTWAWYSIWEFEEVIDTGLCNQFNYRTLKMYQIEFHHGLRVRSDTLVPFMISSLVQKFTFESLRKFRKGKIHVFRPTCGSGFSCYRVMVNSKYFLLRRTRSLVSHARQLKVLFCQFNGAPLLCHFLVVCCIHIIYILPLACCFISSSLKNDSLSSGV